MGTRTKIIAGQKAIINKGSSAQIELWSDQQLDEKGAIRPVADKGDWSQSVALSTRHARCVSIMARNTVGKGVTIDFSSEYAEADPVEKAIAERMKKQLQELIEKPNKQMPISTVFEQVKADEESTGDGYLECVRGPKDELGRRLVKEIYHIPGQTVRVTKDALYIQRDLSKNGTTGEFVYFKPFGDLRKINRFSGKIDPTVNDTNEATEILQFSIYSPLDQTYGIPRAYAAEQAIYSAFFIRNRNANFFKSDATPRMVIIMEGGSRPDFDAACKQIESFVDGVKGNTEASRVMALQVTASGAGKDKPTLRIENVGYFDQDATFTKQQAQADEEIREAYGIAKILLGTADDVNRASALATMKSTIDNILAPETDDYSYRLTHSIAREYHPLLSWYFIPASVEDLLASAQMDDVYANKIGAVSINEIRKKLELDPSEHELADLPILIVRKLPGTAEGAEESVTKMLEALGDEMGKIRAGVE